MGNLTRTALVLSVVCLGFAERARADGPASVPAPSVDDVLVGRLLDAPVEQKAALEAALWLRGEPARAALERARLVGHAQRGWLAEAFATRAATRDAALPELKAAHERASRVLRVMLGRAPEDPRPDDEQTARRRADDAAALLAEGDVRALPWVEHFADLEGVPWDARVTCARVLVVRKVPGGVGRMERVLDGGSLIDNALVDEVGAVGTVEAVPFLVRALADKARVGDGDAHRRAARALERLRGLPGFAQAHDRPLALERRLEAEAKPLLHSTGALVSGGWQARRGRDGVEHMVYGPYVTDLPHETLHARFRYRIDHAGTTKDSAYLSVEVTSQEMEHQGWPIQSHHVLPADTPVGEWRERDLVFFPHPAGSRMEFRVRWHGTCDATVDRIDLLRTRERTDADRALDPPRATAPWKPGSVAPLGRDAGLALLDAALRLPTPVPAAAAGRRDGLVVAVPSGPWRTLREVLLGEPDAREVLGLAAADAAAPERAWLARAWRDRLEHTVRWDELERALDAVLAYALTPPPWRFRSSGGHPRRSEAALAAGRAAVRIEVIAPKAPPEGLEWLRGPAVDGQMRAHPDGAGDAEVLLPASPLWPSIFAETWLLSWRGPLPPAVNFGGKKPIAAVPSTVGVLRLHALQQLGWFGEGRVFLALESLAADPSATAEERAVAARLLTAYPK